MLFYFYLLIHLHSFDWAKERSKKTHAVRRIFPLRRWRGLLRNYWHNNYKNTKFASLRFDFCSCSLVNVAKIRYRGSAQIRTMTTSIYWFMCSRTFQKPAILWCGLSFNKKLYGMTHVNTRHRILARFSKKNGKNQVFERSEFRQFLPFLDKHACVKKSV